MAGCLASAWPLKEGGKEALEGAAGGSSALNNSGDGGLVGFRFKMESRAGVEEG